jgi:hypothetical protein
MPKGSIVPHLVRMASPSQRNDQEESSGVLRWALAEFDVPVLPGHDPKLMHEYPTGVIQYG